MRRPVLLFITNRFPREGIAIDAPRTFTFDLDNNGASNSVFFCDREQPDVHKEIGNLEFFKRIRESEYQQILLYIHGFSNLPSAVFEATTEMQNLFDNREQNKVQVVPMIWPCDGDVGIVKDYWDDQKAADQSKDAFARVLEKFMWWRNEEEHNPANDPCLKRINILAHSMGARVLRETLVAWNKHHLGRGVPLLFRNTFMVAADIVNESLHKGEPGELISHASRNVVVYYASDDLALRASKAANLKNKVASRRLGHSGPEDMSKTPKNVHAVDCDEVNTESDPKGHTYFRSGAQSGTPGAVFEHIYASIDTGRVPRVDELQPI